MADMSGGPGYITITITGQTETRRRLVTWGAKIEDLTPAWQTIRDDLRNDIMEQFLGEGGNFGKWSKWQPLRPATVRDRIRRGYGGAHPMEWREGNLMRSFLFDNADGNVTEIRTDSLRIGSTYVTAGWQHYGTPHMVARPLVGISYKRRAGIVDRLNQYIMDQARQQGFLTDGGD